MGCAVVSINWLMDCFWSLTLKDVTPYLLAPVKEARGVVEGGKAMVAPSPGLGKRKRTNEEEEKGGRGNERNGGEGNDGNEKEEEEDDEDDDGFADELMDEL